MAVDGAKMNARRLVETEIKAIMADAGYTKKGTCWSKRDGGAVLALYLLRGSGPDACNYHIGAYYPSLLLSPLQKKQSFPLSNSDALHWNIYPDDLRKDLAEKAEKKMWCYFDDPSMTLEQRLEIFVDVARRSLPILASCTTLEGLQLFLEELNPTVHVRLEGILPTLYPMRAWREHRKAQFDAYVKESIGARRLEQLVARAMKKSLTDPSWPDYLRGHEESVRRSVLLDLEPQANLIPYKDYCELKGLRPPLWPANAKAQSQRLRMTKESAGSR